MFHFAREMGPQKIKFSSKMFRDKLMSPITNFDGSFDAIMEIFSCGRFSLHEPNEASKDESS